MRIEGAVVRVRLRVDWPRVWMRVIAAIEASWVRRMELLTVLVALVGWLLLTRAVVTLTGPVAWDVSIGLLLLSLAGWKLVYRVALEGLFELTRGDDE